MARFSKGRRALAISDRSGAAFPYNEMVKEWTGAWVHISEFEPKQPQLQPHPVGAAGVYGTPNGIGGITGTTIAKAAGYSITVGKYINGATDTSGTNGTNWFHFSADTNATQVVNGGGGYPVSVGPVTLQA